MSLSASLPRRIVCLTEETTEILYLLGEEDRIVGISGFTVRPPRARREKPKVSAFTSAKIERIVALKPDMVLGFSDLQADIAADLIRQGMTVLVFNQRSVDEILSLIRILGGLVGAQVRAESLVSDYSSRIAQCRAVSSQQLRRPRVYFEEWDDPPISAIRWVSELIGIAGGDDIFPELATSPGGAGRIIADSEEIVRRSPDIIIGSWRGKKFRPEKVAARPGWQALPPVAYRDLHALQSAAILPPAPAALTDALDQLTRLIPDWHPRAGP